MDAKCRNNSIIKRKITRCSKKIFFLACTVQKRLKYTGIVFQIAKITMRSFSVTGVHPASVFYNADCRCEIFKKKLAP